MCNGASDADCEMHESPQGVVHDYKKIPAPWTCASQQATPGHEFHYSRLTNMADGYDYSFDVKRGFGVDGHNDGICYKNLLACYTHQRNTKRNPWIPDFLNFIKSCAQG